mmetsp:Transcript_108713/g.313229  ORF Transcript_108713/g.313229 Transcript_108713/m.313229 type:complete len:223 (+) Transcript_108713:984-1652(+)
MPNCAKRSRSSWTFGLSEYFDQLKDTKASVMPKTTPDKQANNNATHNKIEITSHMPWRYVHTQSHAACSFPGARLGVDAPSSTSAREAAASPHTTWAARPSAASERPARSLPRSRNLQPRPRRSKAHMFLGRSTNHERMGSTRNPRKRANVSGTNTSANFRRTQTRLMTAMRRRQPTWIGEPWLARARSMWTVKVRLTAPTKPPAESMPRREPIQCSRLGGS